MGPLFVTSPLTHLPMTPWCQYYGVRHAKGGPSKNSGYRRAYAGVAIDRGVGICMGIGVLATQPKYKSYTTLCHDIEVYLVLKN